MPLYSDDKTTGPADDIAVQNHFAQIAYESLYICEPDKNIDCKKSNCFKIGGTCYMTKNKEFRKD